MVHQLIDRRIDETGELDLRDRPETLGGETYRQPGDDPFGKRRIEDAVGAKALQQSLGSAEHAAFGADILAEDENSGVLRHGAGERQVDRLDERDLGHGGLTSVPYRAPPGAARRDHWARFHRY